MGVRTLQSTVLVEAEVVRRHSAAIADVHSLSHCATLCCYASLLLLGHLLLLLFPLPADKTRHRHRPNRVRPGSWRLSSWPLFLPSFNDHHSSSKSPSARHLASALHEDHAYAISTTRAVLSAGTPHCIHQPDLHMAACFPAAPAVSWCLDHQLAYAFLSWFGRVAEA